MCPNRFVSQIALVALVAAAPHVSGCAVDRSVLTSSSLNTKNTAVIVFGIVAALSLFSVVAPLYILVVRSSREVTRLHPSSAAINGLLLSIAAASAALGVISRTTMYTT